MSKVEYEKRFLVTNSNFLNLKNELIGKGAVEIGSNFQERVVFSIDNTEMRWGRLRTNGKITTLAVKEKTSKRVMETEVEVSDFLLMKKILEMMGVSLRARHQNHRTELEFKDARLGDRVALSFDAWPELLLKIGYLLEVEAFTNSDLIQAIAILGLNLDSETMLEPWSLYEQVGLGSIHNRDLVFSDQEMKLISIS